MGNNKYLFPMIVMSILFFMVGFITTMNNSLINFLSTSKWMLSFTEKQLINTAFFGAYLFSVPLSYLLNRLGYKASAVLSLFIITIGFISVYPAVSLGYWAFLSSMFVVAIGITLLQIVLNPYVLALGDPKSAASRLNLTGFFNSVATVIAPIFVAALISTSTISEDATMAERPDPENVRIPFLFIAAIALLLGVVLFKLKLPEIKEQETKSINSSKKSSPYKYPHLMLGAIAIFVYMGIEIGIPSFLPDRMKALGIVNVNILGYDLNSTSILSIYWGGLMIGRLIGSVLLQKISARTVTVFCASMGIICLGGSIILEGQTAIIMMTLCGLFNSIMWGNIFNLASEDLGEHTKRASGIICSFAIGGAILPPLMGLLQQSFGSNALTVGTKAALCCLFVYYIYIILFAAKLSKIRILQE